MGIEYLEIIIKFGLQLRSFLPPSFMKHTVQDKNTHSSVAIIRNYTSVT
jgi:hypothetical protein